jgi:hypothetical protein
VASVGGIVLLHLLDGADDGAAAFNQANEL